MSLTAFRSLLMNDAAVTALVSTRIYPQVAKTIQYPLIVLQQVSTTPTKVLHEASGMDRVRMQVSVYSENYLQGTDIAAKVRAAVDNYSGTIETVKLNRVSFETERDVYETGLEVHHIATDYILLINK